MPPTETPDGKVLRLEAVLVPFLRQLLRDAPLYGEISITASLHDGDVGRVTLGAVVARKVAPREARL